MLTFKRVQIFLIGLLFAIGQLHAQDIPLEGISELEESIESILANNPDISEAQLNEIVDRLTTLYYGKLNINQPELSILAELMLLNDLQLNDIRHHIATYGPFLELYELQSVPSLGISDIRRIMPFLLPVNQLGVSPFSWKMLYEGSKTLMVRYSRQLEESRGYMGDEPKYLGSRDRVSLRLRHIVPGRVSIGIGMEKDAGEPFSTKYNPLLFDFTTFHLSLEKVNKVVNRVVLGDFQASAGQGLVLFSGYGFGKSAFTTEVKRSERMLRPSTSLNEINALRGGGVELNLSKNITLMTFVSLNRNDGNAIIPDSIDNDLEEVISSLQMTGLHRTQSEIDDKDHVRQFTTGGAIKYRANKLSIGLNTVYDRLNRSLEPADRLYNRYYFKGREAMISSVDYSYFFRNVAFFGETAINPAKAVATVNGALVGLHSKVSLALLFRHLPKEYYTLHGRVFADNSQATNETGIYIGTSIKPTARLQINAYADFYKHSWPTFLAPGPSDGSSYLLKISYQKRKHWDSYIQFRYQAEQIAGVSSDALPPLFTREKTDIRLHFTRNIHSLMTWSSRFETSWLQLPGSKSEQGYLMYQELWAKPAGLSLSGFIRFGLFKTDSYQSRIYTYEHYLAYDSRNVAFNGNGMRFVTGARYKMWNGITLEASYNLTKYNNQDEIGSGNDLISGNVRSEIRAQIRYGIN